MRKLMMILTLATSMLALTGVSSAFAPPDCGGNCPWTSGK